jgi:hypothetical protein
VPIAGGEMLRRCAVSAHTAIFNQQQNASLALSLTCEMKQFKLLNNVVGWLVFLVAAFTYVSTVEPTASFWDCPEFITTAYRLEVGHPPGAPFFMLTGKFFSLFASGPEQVAYWINVMSALLSAFCILFLFWSITHLTRKLLCTDGVVETLGQTLTILASGVAGALAYTWSDTFWFSAVEGEVYAYSSMFTALVFWLILKWEDNADSPHADRWIVLIFYLTGLSIGVHLLNLLCLPAIVLVYYYKKTPDANLKGSLMALGLSIVLVAAVLYGVVPGIVKVGGWFELFFVNVLGLPFNSGMIIYILVLIGVVSAALWSTLQSNRVRTVALYLASVGMLGIPFYGKGYVMPLLLGAVVLCALWFLLQWKKNGQYVVRKRALNTSLLCMLMLMIGYSSYALIVLRSAQNTPMDQNSPEDIFSLGTYLNREQYGQKPLLYGQAFTSQAVGYGKEESVQRHEKKNANEPDKYDIVEVSGQPVYPSAQKMLFPRMFSRLHAGLYQQWLGGVDTKPVEVRGQYEGQAYDFTGEMPSQWDNLRFFLSYQVNFMYWRYFMWNFAGRQNDIQSYGELEHGQWITGIPFIDNALYGDQSKLPADLRENKGHNVFYCLPLLLGLLGMFWQAYRGKKGIQQFWVVFFLFFMTGLAIILYLNQTPSEPRERDYAYAGSFYAFAIWIGLGIAALVEGLRRFGKLPHLAAAGIASVVALAVPLQMVSQTWDDHDRSGRTAARDFGMNYLYSLDEKGNPVIFTNGDNDTFPLWYGQDVEGERTDARVCNLSYLQTDWYIDQMRRPAWNSPSLPITWKRWEYVDNMGHDAFMVRPELKEQLLVLKKDFQAQGKKDDPFELQYIIDNFVRNPEIACVPTDSIVLTVDKAAVLRSGMKLPHGKDSIPEKMHISLRGKRMLTKSEMMVYEMLAHHNWTRPLYMSTTLGGDNQAGLDNYLMLEGLAARITPFNVGSGGTDSERMYDNFMRKFRYGNVADPKVYVDQTVMRPCYTHRLRMAQLAQQLLMEGKRDKALKVLQKCEQVLPPSQVPYEVWSLGIDTKKHLLMMPECYRELGKTKEAEAILKSVADRALAYFDWYNSFSENRLSSMSGDIIQQYEILGMALDGLQACKSSSLIENYKKRADVLAGTPAGRVLISAMNARRAADAQRYLPEDAEEGAEY